MPVTVRRVVWGVVLLANQWFVSTIAYCQVPPVRATIQPHDLVDAAGWMKNGGYHAARQDMEDIFSQLTSVDEKRDAIFILMQSSFEDQEYEEAFQWAAEYLGHYPNDARRQTALFIRGVSAFQTQRVEVARDDLEKFLGLAPDHSKNGAASFWLAMTKLDEGDWAAAESDLQHTYEDPAALNYHDIALMGWALSLERRGAWTEAIHHLEEFITQFPRSNLLPSVKIRLASLSLRVGAPHRTLEVLEGTTPSTHSQREEYSLLQAEAALRSGSYEDAQFAYGRFVKEFPDGRYARKALYGLAWSRVKRGDYFGAQEVFDSLGRSSDSLAYAALYQSGILALLQDKSNEALARFDTLTEHSPYDFYAESAYFQMGMIRYRGKHYRDARRYFQLAARMFPESNRRALSYRMLGESNLALGDFSNAQYAFGQVRRLSVSSDLLAPSMFQEGTCLYHLGRFKSSAEMFTNYLRLFSHDVHAAEGYVWKGEALYQDYRFTEAERAFSDALRLFSNNPKRPDAVYGMAWSLFEQKKFSQAASAFERFMKDFPGDQRGLDASLRRADCYFFQGEYEKASGMYEALAAARTESRTVEYAAFQLAMSYIQRGESERGINQLRNFISRFPSSLYNEVVQFNIGWEYFSREQYTLAVPELRTVIQKYPDSQLMPRVLFNMGDAFYNLKQYDSARVYYQRVLKDYPQSLLVPDALNGLQFTYEAAGKPAGALAEIDTLLSSRTLGAPKEELVLRKADILFGQGDFAAAIREYQTILSMKPSRNVQAKALHQLGRTYEMENNPHQAISYYKRVIGEFTDADVAPAVTLALGTAQIKTKQFRDAAATLEPFSSKYPDSPLLSEARYYYGVALSGFADKSKAIAQFQTVIDKHPTDVFADRSRLRMAEVFSDRKEYRAALDTLTELVTRRSDDLGAEALVMIGQNYLAMKKPTDALQAFNDVIRQYTDVPLMVERARMGLGEAYEKLHDRKRARDAYQEVVNAAIDPAMKRDAQDRLRKLRR